jgi:hypothetical protein
MHHLRWSAVSVKAKAEANLNFHRNRFCVFKNLVQDDTVSLLLESAKAAEYHQIFNKFKVKTSDRRAAKACDLGNLVVAQFLTFCQDCLIAGDSHILIMGRGASFLKSLPGCSAQDTLFRYLSCVTVLSCFQSQIVLDISDVTALPCFQSQIVIPSPFIHLISTFILYNRLSFGAACLLSGL